MAIDRAVSQTAVEAWDKRWATSEGRADWLEPHPAVVAILPELRARGAKRVLDLGCGVGRHALLLAEHGFNVEALDGSPAGDSETLLYREIRNESEFGKTGKWVSWTKHRFNIAVLHRRQIAPQIDVMSKYGRQCRRKVSRHHEISRSRASLYNEKPAGQSGRRIAGN